MVAGEPGELVCIGFSTSMYSGGAPGGDDPVLLHKEQEARSRERNASVTLRNIKYYSY
jgi:hypothetical protein